MATHSSTCAWKIPWAEEPGRLQSMGLQESDTTVWLTLSLSSSHVWMWGLDHKEGWAPKNLCFQTVVLEKTLESPLDRKEIQPIHSKGNQSWIFMERLMLKLKLEYFGHLNAKNWLIWKDPWCWERLKAGREGDNRGWDGWMASLTQCTWVWANSGR